MVASHALLELNRRKEEYTLRFALQLMCHLCNVFFFILFFVRKAFATSPLNHNGAFWLMEGKGIHCTFFPFSHFKTETLKTGHLSLHFSTVICEGLKELLLGYVACDSRISQFLSSVTLKWQTCRFAPKERAFLHGSQPLAVCLLCINQLKIKPINEILFHLSISSSTLTTLIGGFPYFF